MNNHMVKNKEAGELYLSTKQCNADSASLSGPLFLSQTNVLYCIKEDVQQNLSKNLANPKLALSESEIGRNPESRFFCVKEGDETCEHYQREEKSKKRTLTYQPAWRSAPACLSVARFLRHFKLLQRIQHFGVCLAVTILTSVIGFCGTLKAETVSLNSYNVEKLVSAIYLAEGGERSKKPFGILSVPCSDYTSCKKICTNTVRNNLKRWEKAGKPGDYLEFLAKRYAPIGVSNDPRNLNQNWYSNVKKIYGRMK
jgi:hypothetical protein